MFSPEPSGLPSRGSVAVDDDGLPPVAPLPPLVAAGPTLEERQYGTLFRHVVRAVTQRVWLEETFTEADIGVVLSRAQQLFCDRAPALSQENMSAMVSKIRAEPRARAVNLHCAAFTSDVERVIAADSYRAEANFFDPREAGKFQHNMMAEAQKRIAMSNAMLSTEAHRRERSTKMFQSISGGHGMGAARSLSPLLNGTQYSSDFQRGCFGGVLQVEVLDLSWRKGNADVNHSEFGMLDVRSKLQVSVQLLVDDEPKAETVVRGSARETVSDPGAPQNADEPIEIASSGTARFWKWREPTATSLFIGSGSGLFTADRTRLVVHVKQPGMLGTCFGLDTIATIEIGLESLYTDIMPADDPSREKFNAGFHFTYRHHVDPTTGMGATLAINLECSEPAHHAAPHNFDPTAPADSEAVPSARELEEWGNAFDFPHHTALLHLVEMCEELSDVEYEMLNAYSDFFFLDRHDLLYMAVNIARAKAGSVHGIDDLRDALYAVDRVMEQHTTTYMADNLRREARPAIRQRFLAMLCETETFMRPRDAPAAIHVARDMLERLQLRTYEISGAVSDVIQRDFEERTRFQDTINRDTLQMRSSQALAALDQEVSGIENALAFSRAASDERVSALMVHRIAAQLQVMTPFVQRYVHGALGLLVAAGEQADQFAESFRILCAVQQKTVACFELLQHEPQLRNAAADLVAVFATFLEQWLPFTRSTVTFSMGQVARITPLEPISDTCMYCEGAADAVQLLAEVVDFFWQCAACSRRRVVANSLPVFAALLRDLARTFFDALAKRFEAPTLSQSSRQQDQGRSGRTGRTGGSSDSDPEVLEMQLLGAATLGQYVDLLGDLWQDALAPTKPLVPDQEHPFHILVPKCRELLSDGLTDMTGAIADFMRQQVSETTVVRMIRSAVPRALDTRRPSESSKASLGATLETLARSCLCPHLEGSTYRLIGDVDCALAIEISCLADLHVDPRAAAEVIATVGELKRRASIPGAEGGVLVNAETAVQLLDAHTQPSLALVQQLDTLDSSGIDAVLLMNVLCARANTGGDSVARTEVNRGGYTVRRSWNPADGRSLR